MILACLLDESECKMSLLHDKNYFFSPGVIAVSFSPICLVHSSLPRGNSHSCKLNFSPIYVLLPLPSYSLVHGLFWCTRKECSAWLKSGYRLFTCIGAVICQRWCFLISSPCCWSLQTTVNCCNGYERWNSLLKFFMTSSFCCES